MTLNVEMALILHYFTEFVYDVVALTSEDMPKFILAVNVTVSRNKWPF